MQRVGILTGGGDCPGLNAVIRGAVMTAARHNISVTGIRNGWKGLIEADAVPLDAKAVADILPKGGTILGTSRTNPYKKPGDVEKAIEGYKKLKLDALIAVGGEDTLGVANKLLKEGKGLNIVGCPKTIDNDLSGTDSTFGFDTAVNIATEAVDRLHTTAESHHRIMVVEVMGRHAGWIALHAGLAASADYILIPEVPTDLDKMCAILKKRRQEGKEYGIIVAAEGAALAGGQTATKDVQLDSFGHVMLGGIGEALAKEIEKRTGFETRSVVLGHLQRGGAPTTFDRIAGMRFGAKAMDLIIAGKFGYMSSLQGTEVNEVPIEVAVGKLKTVDPKLYELAKTFFG
ncbi:MAG: ATP-dependent 6-phosphofructokinase [Candidatus Omnitrophica bacterium]|nr:ATP-dependent 6-phosphofructokinase [Candidatus Omnitrophota bacterium]